MLRIQKVRDEFSVFEHVEAELAAISESTGVKVKPTTPDLTHSRPNMSPFEARLSLLNQPVDRQQFRRHNAQVQPRPRRSEAKARTSAGTCG